MRSGLKEEARLRILRALLARYERSAHYADPGTSRRRVLLRPEARLFPDYWNDRSPDAHDALNEAARELEAAGLIAVEWAKNAPGRFISRMALSLDQLEAAYAETGTTPRRSVEEALRETALRWKSVWREVAAVPSWAHDFLSRFASSPAGGPFPAGFRADNHELLDDVCRALDAAFRLDDDTPYRIFSARVFGDSKAIERLKPRLVRVLREHLPRPMADEPDALLSEINLVANPQHVFLSGPIVLEVAGTVLDISHMPDVGLSTRTLRRARIVRLEAERILTIENLASFYAFLDYREARAASESPTVAIYLGGFPNRIRRDFLKAIHEMAADVRFEHWGDMDLGGMRIFRHLRDACGLPVLPFKMDRATYLAHLHLGKPFPATHKDELRKLLDDCGYTAFAPLIKAMLEHGRRVEQESVVL